MRWAVIVPAAGVGRRFADGGDSGNKLEAELRGRPVFLRSLEPFLGRPEVAAVILAVNPDTIDEFSFRWGDKLAFHGVRIVPGGKRERWETVLRALDAVPAEATHIAVHDAARPLVTPALIERVFAAAADHAAVIPALPVANTLKRVRDQPPPSAPADPLDAIFGDAGKIALKVRRVVETVDRRDLAEVQTPQAFEVALIRRAYAEVAAGRLDPARITDDAGLVEALGEPVVTVDGEPTNFKITRPGDLELAAALVDRRETVEAKETARKRLFGDDED